MCFPALLASLFLALCGAPRLGAAIPLLAFPACGVVLLSGWVRRLHDTGVHARLAVASAILKALFVLSPLAVFALEAPDWTRTASLGWVCLSGLVTVAFFNRRPHSWQPGDSGPNAFGDAPAA